jgi:aldehyde:ferredoxin oxidoreductase
MTVFSSLCICCMGYPNVKFKDYCNAYRYATGSKQDDKEILRRLEAITNLRRAFNIKCGLTAKHDYLPKRILTLSRDASLSQGHLPDLEPMLKEYYKFRQWDMKTGKPKKQKLIELGLEDVSKDLWQ